MQSLQAANFPTKLLLASRPLEEDDQRYQITHQQLLTFFLILWFDHIHILSQSSIC